MNKCQNILFYTSHPDDMLSRQILAELANNKLLEDQFVKICVSNPNLKLPRVILEMDTFPVIVSRGFNQPIKGEHALTWIKEGNFSGIAGVNKEGQVLDFGNVDMGSELSEAFAMITNEYQKTGYHQQFNDQYNLGVDSDKRVISNQFSNVKDVQKLNTIDEDERFKSKNFFERQLKYKQEQRDKVVKEPMGANAGSYLSRGSFIDQPNGSQPQQYRPRPGDPLPHPSQLPENQHLRGGHPNMLGGNNHLRSVPMNPVLNQNQQHQQQMYAPPQRQQFQQPRQGFPAFPTAPNEQPRRGDMRSTRMQHPSMFQHQRQQQEYGKIMDPHPTLAGPPQQSNRPSFPTPNFSMNHGSGSVSGFGNMASLDSAHNGQSLSGRPMETRFHTRRPPQYYR